MPASICRPGSPLAMHRGRRPGWGYSWQRPFLCRRKPTSAFRPAAGFPRRIRQTMLDIRREGRHHRITPDWDPAWRNQAGRSINGTTQRIAAGAAIKPIGARAVGKVVNDDRADWREAWALFTTEAASICHMTSFFTLSKRIGTPASFRLKTARSMI
jgi:hypothetical protein